MDKADEIAEQVIIDYNTQKRPGWILRDYLADALRAYGEACAAAEREWCGVIVHGRAVQWEQLMKDDQTGMAKPRFLEACDIGALIRADPTPE